MKAIVLGLFGLLSIGVLAQESKVSEEFLPIVVEGKEAFMSTKTGEYTYLNHDKTDATQLKTTASGVVYTAISNHTIKKGETLSAIAKKNAISVDEIKKYNKVSNSSLKIGTNLKIVKKLLVKSSSPVISYAGEKRIIAALRPGESPGQFAAPPSVAEVESKAIETKKSEEKALATPYKAKTSIKNPILGINNAKNTEETSTENLSEVIKEEVKAVVTNTPKPITTEVAKIESKKEKLARLKAEMEALESEIEVETTTKNTEEVKTAATDSKTVAKKTVVLQIDKEIEAITTTGAHKQTQVTLYTVAKGNSLWYIAQKHNMTVDALKKLNNLKNNNIAVGQQLKVVSSKK